MYVLMRNSEDEAFELPDGQIIRLKDERFLCTEILFQPHLIGKEIPGLLDSDSSSDETHS